MQRKLVSFLNQKAFVFSFEAIFALLIFCLLVFSSFPQESFSLKELALTQEVCDLLRVWSAGDFSESAFASDTVSLFGSDAELLIDGQFVLKNYNLVIMLPN